MYWNEDVVSGGQHPCVTPPRKYPCGLRMRLVDVVEVGIFGAPAGGCEAVSGVGELSFAEFADVGSVLADELLALFIGHVFDEDLGFVCVVSFTPPGDAWCDAEWGDDGAVLGR